MTQLLTEVNLADLLREVQRRKREHPLPQGRPKVPTHCPRCGELRPSHLEARAHCRKEMKSNQTGGDADD